MESFLQSTEIIFFVYIITLFGGRRSVRRSVRRVGARRTGDETIVLTKLESCGCHVIPLETFLYGFLGTAEHPNFRLISKLVRDRARVQ